MGPMGKAERLAVMRWTLWFSAYFLGILRELLRFAMELLAVSNHIHTQILSSGVE